MKENVLTRAVFPSLGGHQRSLSWPWRPSSWRWKTEKREPTVKERRGDQSRSKKKKNRKKHDQEKETVVNAFSFLFSWSWPYDRLLKEASVCHVSLKLISYMAHVWTLLSFSCVAWRRLAFKPTQEKPRRFLCKRKSVKIVVGQWLRPSWGPLNDDP